MAGRDLHSCCRIGVVAGEKLSNTYKASTALMSL